VMTTNAGVRETERKSMGFKAVEHDDNAMAEINRVFSPEFRNRLDGIIWFNHLSPAVIAQVVEKFLAELEAQLDARGVTLEVDAEAKTWLAEKGYDHAMGARPMSRVIQEHLKKPLANELLFGKLADGGKVTVTVADDDLKLDVQGQEAATTA